METSTPRSKETVVSVSRLTELATGYPVQIMAISPGGNAGIHTLSLNVPVTVQKGYLFRFQNGIAIVHDAVANSVNIPVYALHTGFPPESKATLHRGRMLYGVSRITTKLNPRNLEERSLKSGVIIRERKTGIMRNHDWKAVYNEQNTGLDLVEHAAETDEILVFTICYPFGKIEQIESKVQNFERICDLKDTSIALNWNTHQYKL